MKWDEDSTWATATEEGDRAHAQNVAYWKEALFASMTAEVAASKASVLAVNKRLDAMRSVLVALASPNALVDVGAFARSALDADNATGEAMAKAEGSAAKQAGIRFHDNPYRTTNMVRPHHWLYSAWEYGYTHETEAK